VGDWLEERWGCEHDGYEPYCTQCAGDRVRRGREDRREAREEAEEVDVLEGRLGGVTGEGREEDLGAIVFRVRRSPRPLFATPAQEPAEKRPEPHPDLGRERNVGGYAHDDAEHQAGHRADHDCGPGAHARGRFCLLARLLI
jgi:hypothetical protein